MGSIAPYRINCVPPGTSLQAATVPIGSQVVFADRGGLFLMQPQAVPQVISQVISKTGKSQRTPPAVALFAESVADGGQTERHQVTFGYKVAERRGGSSSPPHDSTFGEWQKEVETGEGPISRWIATTLRRKTIEFLERRYHLQPADTTEVFDQAVSRLFSEEPTPHPLVSIESLIRRWILEEVQILNRAARAQTAVGSELSHGAYDPETRGMGDVRSGILRMATEAMEGAQEITLVEFLRAAEKEKMREALEKAFYARADEKTIRIYDALHAGRTYVEIARDEGVTLGMLGSRRQRMWAFLRAALRSLPAREGPLLADDFLTRVTETQRRRAEALFRGEKMAKIARREGVSVPTIFKLKRKLQGDFGVAFPKSPRRVVAKPPRQAFVAPPILETPVTPPPPPPRIEGQEDPERIIGAWLPLLTVDVERAVRGLRPYVLGWETLPAPIRGRKGRIRGFTPDERGLMLAFELLDHDLPRATRALRWTYSQTWDTARSLVTRCRRYKERLATL